MTGEQVILLILAGFMFFRGIMGIKRGRIQFKWMRAFYKSDDPVLFWLSIMLLFGFGLSIVFLAFWK